ncbi:DNA polymerase delta subunit 2 [Capronia coronata CBS 617.96]|uniref:DNA polymerase delta subunit 2 n=1 Tax=Capronia coronata CBS 617.96 TaxID=1182541 RepID=W9ZPM1_9EURO|nr:DNA polymerase delta subunit 2 [Capronia coronata CBS 617.96]EXJ96409.1 DNA polymerase delta subunit 2 [Capronia coronata CBS 617.96]
MRINEYTAVSTKKVLLVPYSAHHVPKYHEWMKDPDIQEATASEPLTLDEEYAMQRSWRVDADKLTFIICRPEHNQPMTRDGRLDPDSMIGDVNLFISTAEDDAENQVVAGELELMIAERTEQRRGYGRAALLAFLNYILRHEGSLLTEFYAGQPTATAVAPARFGHFAVKIGETNHRSIALFERLGFHKTSATPSYFGEFELRLGRDEIQSFLNPSSSTGGSLEGYMEIEYSCPQGA